jgi:hypothetical protein
MSQAPEVSDHPISVPLAQGVEDERPSVRYAKGSAATLDGVRAYIEWISTRTHIHVCSGLVTELNQHTN